jgi:hypothetical protein
MRTPFAAAPAALLAAVLLLGTSARTPSQSPGAGSAPSTTASPTATGSRSAESSSGASSSGASPTGSASTPADERAILQYLIEEEKLAHDVYQRFAQLWGVGIFDNIRASEVTHQEILLPVLAARGIPDPRTGQAGTFTDQRLQQMYDQLVQQGSASLNDAYRAGVAIEEQDIADLNEDLRALTAPDAVSALQRLLAGSQNHLQAFRARLS